MITSEHALTLDRVPASVIVLGGGVIGCEFASVWRSFGADVTIVEALPRLVAAEDEAVSKALERAFRKRKITFHTGTPFQSVETTDDRRRRSPSRAATSSRPSCCSSPSAAARPPTASATTSRASRWTAASCSTDERCRTNVDGVYAVGDIVPGLQLAHRGFQQGIFVAEEIAGLDPRPIDEAGIPRVTYSDPEVASVGLDRGHGPRDATATTRRDR